MDSSVVCLTCNKSFSTTQTRNLNIRKFHNVIEDKRVNHIICPLCKNNEPLGTTANLEKHLQETHEIKMEKMSFKFGNKEQYEKWKIEEKMEVNYAINRTKKTSLHKEVHYACNRSDSTGRYKYLILLLVKENYYFYLGYILLNHLVVIISIMFHIMSCVKLGVKWHFVEYAKYVCIGISVNVQNTL
jgi:hypothetical protein